MSKRKILLEELTPLSLQEILDGETFSMDEVENIRLRRNKNIPNKCIRCLYDNYDNDNVKMTKQYVTDAIGELEGRGNGIRHDQVYQGMEEAIVLLLSMPEVDVQVVKTKKGKNVSTWRLQEEAFDQDDFLAEEESAHVRQRNLIEKREKRVTKALQSGLLQPDNGMTRLDKIHQHRRIEE